MPLLLPTLSDCVGEDSPELGVDSTGSRGEDVDTAFVDIAFPSVFASSAIAPTVSSELEAAAAAATASPSIGVGASVDVGLNLSLSCFSFAALLFFFVVDVVVFIVAVVVAVDVAVESAFVFGALWECLLEEGWDEEDAGLEEEEEEGEEEEEEEKRGTPAPFFVVPLSIVEAAGRVDACATAAVSASASASASAFR